MDQATVKARLSSLGYASSGDDDWLINFCSGKVTDFITNFCNIPTVPVELDRVAVDMVCGEFLNVKYKAGKLTLSGLNLAAAGVTSVKEGDTQVSFDASSSDTGRFAALVSSLRDREEDLLCFRRLMW